MVCQVSELLLEVLLTTPSYITVGGGWLNFIPVNMEIPMKTNQHMLDEINQKRRKAAPKKAAPSWKGFINCELSPEDKITLKTTDILQTYPVETTVEELVSLGYKLSQSKDWKNDSYLASLTDNAPDSPTNGYCLTARGGTPAKAMAALFYKHFVLLEDGWETPAEKDDEYA